MLVTHNTGREVAQNIIQAATFKRVVLFAAVCLPTDSEMKLLFHASMAALLRVAAIAH